MNLAITNAIAAERKRTRALNDRKFASRQQQAAAFGACLNELQQRVAAAMNERDTA